MKEYFNKQKNMKSIFMLLSIFIMNIGIQSCTKKVTLKAAKDDIIEVIYYKGDSIDLKVKGIYEKYYVNTGSIVKIDNEFYSGDGNDNKHLMLSTKKDTIFQYENELKYKVEIKKISKDTFKSTSIYINEYGEEYILQVIYYDKDYNIFKIIRRNRTYMK